MEIGKRRRFGQQGEEKQQCPPSSWKCRNKFDKGIQNWRERKQIWKVPIYKPRANFGIREVSINYIPLKQTACFHCKVYSHYTGYTQREDAFSNQCWLGQFHCLPLGPWCRALVSTQKSLLDEYVEPHCLAYPESSSLHKVRVINIEQSPTYLVTKYTRGALLCCTLE